MCVVKSPTLTPSTGVRSRVSWPCGPDLRPEPDCHRRRNLRHKARGAGNRGLAAGPVRFLLWPLKSANESWQSPSQRTADPARVSLRKCCAVNPLLAIGSVGTTATRPSTRPRAAPFEPNNAPRRREKRHHGNAECAASDLRSRSISTQTCRAADLCRSCALQDGLGSPLAAVVTSHSDLSTLSFRV